MPIAIKQAQMKFKDPNTSQYVPVVAAADCSSMINDTSTTAISAWSSQKTAAEIGDIDKQVIISSSQPQDATNKLWISSSGGSEVSVPTYAEFTALDAAKVSDVQIDNISVVTSGVANIPIANASTPGVVKVTGTTYGVQVDNGYLKIYSASNAYIKLGSEANRPIVPYTQHTSVYYGLSKLAGVDLANEDVTVGTYPANSQAAIKTMLGVNVDDVQVNGTSVLSSGVANIPVAASETFGVLRTGYTSTGLQKDQGGYLKIYRATTNDVKVGTEGYRPIVPINQDWAVFYGLAKAAGDSTQSSSNNEVGTYTADAKSAIKTMLGVAVDDVQINGTSILSSGIANIPVASTSAAGVVAIGTGLYMGNSNKICVDPATEGQVKSGESTSTLNCYRTAPIAFYGLSKAAGVNLKNETVTLGEYPDASKIAIQKMLGIYDPPWELIREDTFTNATEADHEITVDANGDPFELTDVIFQFETPKQATYASKATGGQTLFYYGSGSASYYCPEPGSWTQEANSVAHGYTTIIEQRGGMTFVGASAAATNTNTGRFGYRYYEGFNEYVASGIFKTGTKRYISRIKIPAVTGTGHYKLYGKRRWD